KISRFDQSSTLCPPRCPPREHKTNILESIYRTHDCICRASTQDSFSKHSTGFRSYFCKTKHKISKDLESISSGYKKGTLAEATWTRPKTLFQDIAQDFRSYFCKTEHKISK
ncbi:hypothetical protein MKX03_037380, partial [Papaver bracteatum]